MLGFGPVAGTAVAALPGGTTTLYVLSAATGTFTLTGKGVVFDPTELATVGAFTFTGNAATTQLQFTTARGTFALAGNGVVFDPIEAAAAGFYTLTGYAVSLQTTLVIIGAGTFLLNGYDAQYSYDYNVGGTILQPAGGTLSRKRWLELLAQAEAEARGKREAEELRREAALDATRKAIEKARASVLAERAEQQARFAEQQRLRERDAMLASGQGLASLQHATQLANAAVAAAMQQAHAQRLRDQDDDDAMLLLLH